MKVKRVKVRCNRKQALLQINHRTEEPEII